MLWCELWGVYIQDYGGCKCLQVKLRFDDGLVVTWNKLAQDSFC
jgi:hypothetical protein